MQVSVAGLRRNIKNIAHNYTEPQKKVREATSNDPWGPSSTLMSEIADLTYNIEAFAQIMEMLWKRLNDHGKNWRHVYKSLVLLEYLIKTGSERVAQQCKENIFAIQTLKDFQYFEEAKDQGMNVREKAKQLVTLLTSEERLRNERARALKARERFAQTVSGFGSSDSNDTTPTSPTFGGAGAGGFGDVNDHSGLRQSSGLPVNPDLEQARPQTVGEEELQLQLALAMSKEEAEQEEKRRRSDELRLQMALSQSEQEFQVTPTTSAPSGSGSNALVDLLDVDLGGGAAAAASNVDPWGGGGAVGGAAAVVDPWAVPPPVNNKVASPLVGAADPWSIGGSAASGGAVSKDPWSTPTPPHPHQTQEIADPWSTTAPNNSTTPLSQLLDDDDEFSILSKRTASPPTLNQQPPRPLSSTQKKDPLHFLGENSALVNLDNLVPLTKPLSGMTLSSPSEINPFAAPTPAVGTSLLTSSSPATVVNPFQQAAAASAKPTINQMISSRQNDTSSSSVFGGINLSSTATMNPSSVVGGAAANNPWSPVKTEQNPFMK